MCFILYTYSPWGENKAHTCRNMRFMFVTRLYFSSSGIHQTPPPQKKKHVKTAHCLLSDMYSFYPCSMTTMVLWLNPRKNAKNAWPDMCFPSTNRAPLWPAALGDAFSTWCIFVGGRGKSLLGCWFSLAQGKGPTDWAMQACGRGSTERTNRVLLHKTGFSPKTLAGVKPMRRLLNMLSRNNCNQWQKRNPSVPWWGILGCVMWLISELGGFFGDPERKVSHITEELLRNS